MSCVNVQYNVGVILQVYYDLINNYYCILIDNSILLILVSPISFIHIINLYFICADHISSFLEMLHLSKKLV